METKNLTEEDKVDDELVERAQKGLMGEGFSRDEEGNLRNENGEIIGRGGRALLEYLVNEACECARAVIEEFPEPAKGVSKREAIFSEYHRFHDKYSWEEEEEYVPQLSMLSNEEFKQYFMAEQAIWALQILNFVEEIKEKEPDFTKLEPGFLGSRMYLIGKWHAQIMQIDLMLDPAIMDKSRALLSKWAMEERWRDIESEKQKEAEPVIQWMLERWGKGEKADHAAFSDYAYDKFDIEKKGISRDKFRSLVKDAAYEHFPHKVRGIKKPPAL